MKSAQYLCSLRGAARAEELRWCSEARLEMCCWSLCVACWKKNWKLIRLSLHWRDCVSNLSDSVFLKYKNCLNKKNCSSDGKSSSIEYSLFHRIYLLFLKNSNDRLGVGNRFLLNSSLIYTGNKNKIFPYFCDCSWSFTNL